MAFQLSTRRAPGTRVLFHALPVVRKPAAVLKENVGAAESAVEEREVVRLGAEERAGRASLGGTHTNIFM
jgi:hypothetical protein